MEIKLNTITIRELIDGFENNEEEGVVGYGGLLNIRPKYQREFVYSETQQKEVINSIFKGFPLNVMYWTKNEDGTFELLDGQQRTLSICSFAEGEFFILLDDNLKAYPNLTETQQQTFLDYKLQIYICENGTDEEKLNWFEIINIAGEKLTKQELRNAVYSGSWVMDAKKKFSKTGCVAYRLGRDYVSGNPIRQDYLKTVIDWISGGKIEEYMANHQNDSNADVEWQYFQWVIAWVKSLFPNYNKYMKSVEWGHLYNRFKDERYNATELAEDVRRLMIDDDVTNKKGIYDYVLSGDERKLQIRVFTDKMKMEAYERQNGICPICKKHYEIEQMHGDHITPWRLGGKTIASNCQMLCAEDNRRKGGV